ETIPALGHTVVTDEAVAPTCTEAGLTEGEHCSACGTILKERETIPALGHTVVTDEAIAPTCTNAGLTEGEHCSVCGTILKEQETIPALGHTVVTDEATAPTCTEAGLTEGKHCSVCGEVLQEREMIPALGHSAVIDAYIAPGIGKIGLTEGTHCSRCGAVLKAQEEIPAVEAPKAETKPQHPEQDSTRERLKLLTSVTARSWPLCRILAFGASAEEYAAISSLSNERFRIQMGILQEEICRKEHLAWINRLERKEFEAAFRLCHAIERVAEDNPAGLRIARLRTMGNSDAEIIKKVNLLPMELRRAYNGYINAVTDVFRRHSHALDFLYANGYFDQRKAEVFFGKPALERIEHCCDMDRIHAFHADQGEKPIGLLATLKTEASNKRTRVLDNWEHLRNYLSEQFDTQPILGSIELDEKEYGLLIRYMRDQYRRQSISISMSFGQDKMICVGLVQIALRCPGTAFWPEVAEALHCSVTPDMMRIFGKCFLSTMKYYRKATFSTSEYVASIKMHSFVSNAYIGRLFDFLFAYYELDLGRNMNFANLEELRDLMISGDYFSRRQMILQQTLDALKLIPEVSLARMKMYLSWIDEAFWHQGWTPDHEDRFARAFREWCAGRPEMNGQWEKGTGSGKRGKRMFLQPTLSMDTNTGSVRLILPVQRLPFECQEQAYWSVSVGDQWLYD
ncbi:MAG TPA: hypothetical protein DHV79_00070, partial [Lachnospiraceae bacterium]|nr:hypothetical protein [Lachnospiraceae bacterium]